MHSNNAPRAVLLGAAIATVCSGACRKDTEGKKAGAAELRSATETRTQGSDGKAEYLVTVRREQLELRGRLQRDIDDVDRKLAELKVELRDGGSMADPKSKRAGRLKELVERRTQLEEHAATLERADERDWDEVKATIEKDVRESQ